MAEPAEDGVDVASPCVFGRTEVSHADAHLTFLELEHGPSHEGFDYVGGSGADLPRTCEEVEIIDDKACMDLLRELLESLDDLFSALAFFSHSAGFKHHDALAARQVCRVDDEYIIE